MRQLVWVAALAAAGLAGCATGSDPAAVAARECSFMARTDGARPLGVEGVDAQADATYKVRMNIEDGLSRRTKAECVYSSTTKEARWATPLPAGFARI